MSCVVPSASARPLVTSGIALAMPPEPVLVPIPAPVRLNHVSNVNCAAPSPGASPNVTYWLDPFNCKADAGAAAVAEPPIKRQRTRNVRTTMKPVASFAVRIGALAFVFCGWAAVFSASSMADSFGVKRRRVAMERRLEEDGRQRGVRPRCHHGVVLPPERSTSARPDAVRYSAPTASRDGSLSLARML